MSQVNNETSITENLRLQNWAEMIRECNDRPAGMKIEDWCKQYGITKHCYYYRFRRVRSLYLQQNLEHQGAPASNFALVATNGDCATANTFANEQSPGSDTFIPKLTIRVNNALVGIDENTPVNLLSKVMEVIGYVK